MIRASFVVKLNDLDSSLIEKLRSVFKNDNVVEINISDSLDETEYLMSTPANRESLEKSLEQLKRRELISISADEL